MIKILLAICLIQGIPEDVTSMAIPRPAKSENNLKAGAFIKTRLTPYTTVTTQPFQYGTNIIGTKTGAIKNTIIVGSHYDSVADSPGADDNASGCVLNLLLAKRLTQKPMKHTLQFVFFDAEEEGLLGSKAYAKKLTDKCDFMVNLDMVGHLKLTKQDTLDDTFQKYPWAKGIVFKNGSDSDHASFRRLGIPVIWVFTDVHSKYHTPRDIPDTLNYEGMIKICEFLETFILKFDKEVDQKFIDSLPTLTESH